MKKFGILLILVAFAFNSCTKIPITGRRQLQLLPESQMVQMSLAQYQGFLNENNVVNSGSDAAMVKRVGQRVSTAATNYLKGKKQLKRVQGFKWEFNLVNDDVANAWCMPGGKVVFYTGILPITKNETGLAVVMGHEIAHAIARHGNERMSQGLIAQLGDIGLDLALANKPQATYQLFKQAYGVSAGLGMLKFSRTHESEADKMGLVFMAIAGYNPQEATKFWERMKASGGANVPQFMSTHPSHETRIKDLQKFMPNALKYYKGAR